MNRAERRAQMRAHNRALGLALPQPVGQNRNAVASGQSRAYLRRDPTLPRSGTDPVQVRSLKFHIDELVLHGFPLKTRHAVSEATQTELTRLLTSSGLPEFVKNPVQSDRLDGGNFNVTSTSKPQTIGSLIANAVYGGRGR